jgi:hypothetical protein
MRILQTTRSNLQNELHNYKTTRRSNYSTNKGNPKMNTNKLWMKLLMASAMLSLLLTAACDWKNAINSPDGEDLMEQGDVIMTVLKAGDLQVVRDLLSRDVQEMYDNATYLASGVLDLESLIEQNAPEIATWKFDRARIFTKDGAIRGKLDGRVEYADGKSGKVSMELEQQDGTWKLCGWTLGP